MDLIVIRPVSVASCLTLFQFILIPLGKLRKQLDDLPKDKDKEIITFCKISLRGYEASLILRANGYTNVKVMEGGIMAWPYAREK